MNGLRVDGRRRNELRHFVAKSNVSSTADGSIYLVQGNTKILCTVSGPKEPPARNLQQANKGVLKISIEIAAFSTMERRMRNRADRRVQELQTVIEQTFEESVQLSLLPRSYIQINLQVLSQDGGLLASCVNAATLALSDAGIPVFDYVVACSIGLIDEEIILGNVPNKHFRFY